MSDSTMRERTIRWHDPLATAEAWRKLSGLDALRAMMAGQLPPPPMAELFGFRLQAVEHGLMRMSIVPDESFYNPMGIVHGGAMATLLDTAMGCAVQSTLPVGRGYTTLNIGVNYLRPITVGTGEVFAEGTVVHSGRTTAVAQGRVVDKAGKVIATGDTTCLLFDVQGD